MISEEVLDKKRNNDETEKMEGEKSFTLFTRRQCDNDEFVSGSLNIYIYIYTVCGHCMTMEELMLSTHVLFQTTRLSKTFLAHVALVRLLVRVHTHVGLQITRLSKTLLANIAFIRFLVRVNTHVLFQSTRITKSFIANIAFIRFLVRVNTRVVLQTISTSKSLLAHITFIRFLVRVRTHVGLQTGWISKHLLANTALVLPSLSLRSFSNSHLFFSYLFVHLILIRYSQTEQHLRFFLLFASPLLSITPRHLQNRPRIFRSFRMWILSSSSHYSVVVVVASSSSFSRSL